MVVFIFKRSVVDLHLNPRRDRVGLGSSLFLEGLIDLRSEVFAACAHDGWDDEAENTSKREEETNPLPEDIVVSVRIKNIVSSRKHKEPPKSPWDEELNGETPPDLEDTFPPASWLTGLLAELSHGTSNLSDTSKTNSPEPFTEAKLGHAD